MEFDKSKVYTSVNADELEVGSTVFAADDLARLKEKVELGHTVYLCVVRKILEEDSIYRFVVDGDDEGEGRYALVYLVEESEEKKLKWEDVKVGDVLRLKMSPDICALVTGKNSKCTDRHICVNGDWKSDTLLADMYEKVEDKDD